MLVDGIKFNFFLEILSHSLRFSLLFYLIILSIIFFNIFSALSYDEKIFLLRQLFRIIDYNLSMSSLYFPLVRGENLWRKIGNDHRYSKR